MEARPMPNPSLKLPGLTCLRKENYREGSTRVKSGDSAGPIFRARHEISGNYARRETPSFFMRDSSVDGFMPRISAAPPRPRMRPPVDLNTLAIWLCSTDSSVLRSSVEEGSRPERSAWKIGPG